MQSMWRKCTAPPADCGLLYDTMSLQWGKFKDLVDALRAQMQQNDDAWYRLQSNLNDQLTGISIQKSTCQTMMNDAVALKNTKVAEKAQLEQQQRDLTAAFEKKMKYCKARLEELIFTDLCAVRNVRNILWQSRAQNPKITDCAVGDWVAGPCSVSCDDSCPRIVDGVLDPYSCGGMATFTRTPIVSNNQWGIPCPALSRTIRCSQFKCPVDCAVSAWSGWSTCTRECEGGVQQQTRSIMVKAKYGGQACPATVASQACNTGSCNRDCTLADWTTWQPCSMGCSPGGNLAGFQTRSKAVLVPIRGQGKCPTDSNPDRYQRQLCNSQPCRGDEVCAAQQDLIIALDASGSLRQTGFELLKRLEGALASKLKTQYYGRDAMRVGAILFGQGARQPDGTVAPASVVQDFTDSLTILGASIAAQTWQRGFTNLAQALTLADSMFQDKGRAYAQSSIMILTDGKYSFTYETQKAVDTLKQKNTMIYMVPAAEREGTWADMLKTWASQPWQTNYEYIQSDSLDNNMDLYTSRLVSKFCPNTISPSAESSAASSKGYALVRVGGAPNAACGVPLTMTGMTQQVTPDTCKALADVNGLRMFAVQTSPAGTTCIGYFLRSATPTPSFGTWSSDSTNVDCPGGQWSANPWMNVYINAPPSSECRATLYKHQGFGGWAASFPVGSFNTAALITAGGADNDASALKVRGRGCTATVYDNALMTEPGVTFNEGDYDTPAFTAGSVRNDQLSAIKVQQLPSPSR